MTFEIDTSEVSIALKAMDNIPRTVLARAAEEIESEGRILLIELFEQAIAIQSEYSFPVEFQEHILGVVEAARFHKIVSGSAFEITFDFNQLGDRADLERAFHQGARLKDGSRLNGPYTGQELNEGDAATRHIYWEAMRKGLQYAPNPKKPGKIPIKPGAWEETKQKYIQIWGAKAPEWLYLQFGQQAWEPTISPYPIIELFNTEFDQLASNLFESLVNEAVIRAEESGVALTPFGGRITGDINEIGPSGKPRRRGQFYPII